MDKKIKIVFLEAYSTVMLYKISKELRKKGHRTILIRILKPNESDKLFYKDAYDEVIDLNIDFVKINLKNIFQIFFSFFKNLKSILSCYRQVLRFKPDIIIGRANPNLPVAFFRILFRKTPFVYFPYDIRVHYAPTIEIAKKERGLSIMEIKAERFCFENSDGILHKGAPEELGYINGRMLGDNINLPKHILAFHPYCSDEFIMPLNKNKLSKKDKEIHLVCIGSGGNRTKQLYELYFETAKHIIQKKINFHVYIGSNTQSEIDEKELFLSEHKDFPNIEYFHIHEALDPKELIREISKYDFAISFPPPKSLPKHNIDPKFAVGNRESTFWEAGIPHFYPYNVEYTDEIMKKYNLSFPISLGRKNNISNIKKRIKKLDYKTLEKNIQKARKDFNVAKNIPLFEKFLISIINDKSKPKALSYYMCYFLKNYQK